MRVKKKENTVKEKNKILDAAFVCFVKFGYAHTTVDDIVKVYGKSKGNIYYYFKNKDDIFINLFIRWQSRLFEMLDSIIVEHKDINVFIEKFFNGFFMYISGNKEFFIVCGEFWSLSIRDKQVKKQLKVFYNGWTAIFKTFLDKFKSRKQFNDFVFMLVLIMDGLIGKVIINDVKLTPSVMKTIKTDVKTILRTKLK